MLIAFVADTHLTETPGESGMSLDEQEELLHWIGEDAEQHGAEALLHAGDVFDGPTTAAERNAAIRVFLHWSSRMPVSAVRGNHDGAGELDYLYYVGHCGGCVVQVLDKAEIFRGFPGLIIASLPWPNKANLAARMRPQDDVGHTAAEALRLILLGFRARFEAEESRGAARVILAHLELGGAKLDNSQPVAGRCEIAIHDHDLSGIGADAVLLGHIHMHQTVGDRIIYAGAPRPTAFGDETPKGYCLVDVQRGKPPQVEHRRAPYREMLTEEAVWDHKDGYLATEAGALDNQIATKRGASVRLLYRVDEANRQQAAEQAERAKARWLEAGAHSVKLDPRISTVHRVRSEEIREARTNEDRLEAWWSARGERPERAEQILGKLQALESEIAK